MLTIQAYALQFETQYKLTVKVFSPSAAIVAPGEEVLRFETGVQPLIGSLKVEPSIGEMFRTPFVITMSDYASPNQPLKYILYGIARDSEERFRITPTFKELDSSGVTTLTLRLPELEAVEVEIQDSVGEINRRREPVFVRVPPGQELWAEVLVDLESSLSAEPAQLWQYN